MKGHEGTKGGTIISFTWWAWGARANMNVLKYKPRYKDYTSAHTHTWGELTPKWQKIVHCVMV